MAKSKRTKRFYLLGLHFSAGLLFTFDLCLRETSLLGVLARRAFCEKFTQLNFCQSFRFIYEILKYNNPV